jgi:hypothetical protein
MMLRYYAASLILPLRSSTVGAFNTGVISSSETGILGSDLDQYREEYVINVSVEANFGESATYTLSKKVQYDLDDLSAANLTLHGTVAFETQGDGAVRHMTVCDATFGDTACRSCNHCGLSTENPLWTVGSNATKFDCEGIVDDRICAGVSVLDRDLEPGDYCYVRENAFDGPTTCFVDAPTAAPTPSPTSSGTDTVLPSVLTTSGFMFLVTAGLWTL